jgi:hypothetical protein
MLNSTPWQVWQVLKSHDCQTRMNWSYGLNSGCYLASLAVLQYYDAVAQSQILRGFGFFIEEPGN